ncbi:uncharacterized protein C8R40DRAFT_635085 [Lentinula edodes]|uniref:uncharacterized protein n=1 Tax=Lentinula edodes TaxID=5353 RepID=UPI001E8D4913|nr:uncharacterized protein C8R40DRAFT_635085 [Lentinula edodes]KAH7870632.1 hypothetical protein C8R40DRAFT_635085 [Lentinula edodes]KAJ3891659.1 hypothetical protein GG344DRAFT_65259 [Lentinula edodes]
MFFPLSLHTLCLFLVPFTVLSNASPTKDTNGYRLARGLPPLPPRDFGRNKPGYEPTPVLRARASPSPSSVARFSGRLQVRFNNGSTIGYVQDQSGLPVSGGSDLQISITTSSTRKEQLNIVATTTNFPSPSFVGASSQGSGNATIGTGSSNFVHVSIVQKTDVLSKPIKSGNGNTSVESAIWTVDLSTKELTAQYVNQDGSLPTTFLVYDNATTNLYLTGDTTASNASVTPVKLFLVN